MIRKLRFKFIAVTMASIGCLFILILLVINLFMTLSSREQGYRVLESAASITESGTFSEQAKNGDPKKDISAPTAPPHPQYQETFRVFSVICDKEETILDFIYHPDSGMTQESMTALFEKTIQNGLEQTPQRGVVSSRYLYLMRQNKNGSTQIYFLDHSLEHDMTYRLFSLCILAGTGGILVLFVCVWFLSGWMVRPVEHAFEKQKQFIADASHELKTPLTIISANAEVLSATLGTNKWLANILAQTQRMNALIRDLLDLAKLDSGTQKNNFAEFNLSSTISASALFFESCAFESHKTFQMEISENILFFGNESAIRQLAAILLDNAFKYSGEGQTVKISLSRKGEKKILTVYNTGKGISQEDQKHIFERFYRSDSSRSRESGGYGLGLAIAKSITEAHGGSIGVKSDGKSYTQITVLFGS